MTQRWAYVGELGPGGALDWGGDWNGNIPKSGTLPELDSEAFWAILHLAEAGAYDGKKTDWGAWALKLNGPQMRDVLTRIYGADLSQPPLAAYAQLAEELGADKYVALVACEL